MFFYPSSIQRRTSSNARHLDRSRHVERQSHHNRHAVVLVDWLAIRIESTCSSSRNRCRFSNASCIDDSLRLQLRRVFCSHNVQLLYENDCSSKHKRNLDSVFCCSCCVIGFVKHTVAQARCNQNANIVIAATRFGDEDVEIVDVLAVGSATKVKSIIVVDMRLFDNRTRKVESTFGVAVLVAAWRMSVLVRQCHHQRCCELLNKNRLIILKNGTNSNLLFCFLFFFCSLPPTLRRLRDPIDQTKDPARYVASQHAHS